MPLGDIFTKGALRIVCLEFKSNVRFALWCIERIKLKQDMLSQQEKFATREHSYQRYPLESLV